MSYPEAPDNTGVAPKHKEAAERAKAGEANNTPMIKPRKLTASQKEKIEEIKAVFGYEHGGIKNIEIENGGEYSKYFASVRGEGNDGERFYALIGTKGAIKHLTVYRFLGHHEYEKDEAERHIRYTLRDMEKKGLWKYPQRKEKPEPSVYGIQFYNVCGSNKGWTPIGVHRNATTEKYFKWAFPKEEMWGAIFEYAYLSKGGEGILLVDIPEGTREPDGYSTPDNRERINFYYEPREVLSVRKTGYEEDLSEEAGRGRTNFSKRFGRSLTVRQIIAKVFKAWLGSKGLL